MGGELKNCPFCGAKPEFKIHICRAIRGNPIYEAYVHPKNDCILSQFEITEDERRDWNKRAEE